MAENIFGYIRVSSRDQNEDRQMIAMRELHIPKRNLYMDKQSGKDFERPEYKKMVRKLKKDGRCSTSRASTVSDAITQRFRSSGAS